MLNTTLVVHEKWAKYAHMWRTSNDGGGGQHETKTVTSILVIQHLYKLQTDKTLAIWIVYTLCLNCTIKWTKKDSNNNGKQQQQHQSSCKMRLKMCQSAIDEFMFNSTLDLYRIGIDFEYAIDQIPLDLQVIILFRRWCNSTVLNFCMLHAAYIHWACALLSMQK